MLFLSETTAKSLFAKVKNHQKTVQSFSDTQDIVVMSYKDNHSKQRTTYIDLLPENEKKRERIRSALEEYEKSSEK